MNPQEIRRKYAEMLRTSANLRVGAIVEAFARVPRRRAVASSRRGESRDLRLRRCP
jgi:hypothetical protein